jgi:hypothetical protein
MRRFATVIVALFCVAFAFAGLTQAAPEWTHANGLDFWKLDDALAQLRETAEEEQDLEDRAAAERRRVEVVTDIASSLCDGRLTLNEALNALCDRALSSPDWLARTRVIYVERQGISATSTDREVMSRYLLIKIRWMQECAEQAGDTSRAAFLSARMASIEEEMRLQANPSPGIVSTR